LKAALARGARRGSVGRYLTAARRRRKGRIGAFSLFFFVRQDACLGACRIDRRLSLAPPQIRTQRLGQLGLAPGAVIAGMGGLVAHAAIEGGRRDRVKGGCERNAESVDLALSRRADIGYRRRSAKAGRRSSVVERILGKAEVGSSILPDGTTFSS
jgi:hypothetical protein